MSIKKAYVELVTLLEANKEKKVSKILDEIYLMVESKKQASTCMRDSDNKVIAIFCYYHKQWELVDDVEYGSKASSTTGLNSMCKVGTSKWTSAQSNAKKAQIQLLKDVATLKVEAENVVELSDKIESDRLAMNVEDMPNGFGGEDELLNYINN